MNRYLVAFLVGVIWQTVGFGLFGGFLAGGYDLIDLPMGLPMTLLLWLPFWALEIPCADGGKKWRHAAFFGAILLLLSPVILRVYFVFHLVLAGLVALAFVVPYAVCFFLYFWWLARKDPTVWEHRAGTSQFLLAMAIVVDAGVGLVLFAGNNVASAHFHGVVLQIMTLLQVFMVYMTAGLVLIFSTYKK